MRRLETLPYLSRGHFGRNTAAHGRHPLDVLHIYRTAQRGSGLGHETGVFLQRSPPVRKWIEALVIAESVRQLVENYRPEDADPRVHLMTEILEAVDFLVVPEGTPGGVRLTFFNDRRRMGGKNWRSPPELIVPVSIAIATSLVILARLGLQPIPTPIFIMIQHCCPSREV